MKKNIALFGGAFDPPHVGHLLVAQCVIKEVKNIHEVWFIPVYKHPFRDLFAPSIHRFSMTKLLAQDIPGCKVIDWEMKEKTTSYTINTVKHFTSYRPNNYYWIIGSDGLSTLPTWKSYDELSSLVTFIVVPRHGYSCTPLPPRALVLSAKTCLIPGVSSTKVRALIKQGKSTQEFLTDQVSHYIIKHSLYL